MTARALPKDRRRSPIGAASAPAWSADTMKHVHLIPGFLASNMGVAGSSEDLWWTPSFAAAFGLGGMRLAANGIDPQPPDGEQMLVDQVAQEPWPDIKTTLQAQLDVTQWRVEVDSYDWRKDLGGTATALTAIIQGESTPAEPATLVGHSAGGIVAALVWARLKAAGQSNLCRRIITLGTPFQGSYLPIYWYTATLASVQQLLVLHDLPSLLPQQFAFWSVGFMNELASTWPAFYELYPALGGTEAVGDPNRALLYDAANYPALAEPSQTWLTFARDGFQPGLAGPDTFPPDYVATYVYGTGLATPTRLNSAAIPLQLLNIGTTMDGDGIVTHGSAVRSPGKIVQVFSSHASMPLTLASNGVLAGLITDPRGPLSPPPPPAIITPALPEIVTVAPEGMPLSPLTCIGGG